MSCKILLVFYILTFYKTVTCQSIDCCPDGWVSYQNSCYLFPDTPPVHFTEAEHYCRQHGGHLVTIETSSENAFLKSFMSRMKQGLSFWIGLSDEDVEGVWKWTYTGLAATFTDWIPGQPDNYQSNEDCAYLTDGSYGHLWNDHSCTDNLTPLCERRKSSPEMVG